MRVRTQNDQTFDFGLNGREIQDTFNLTKYKELAYRSPRGTRLSALVEERWSTWLQTVDEAPWLSSWRRSPHLMRSVDGVPASAPSVSALTATLPTSAPNDSTAAQTPDATRPHAPATTPCGAQVEPGHQAYIALYISIAAVWGYGILGWLSDPTKRQGDISADARNSHALKSLYELQGVKRPNLARTYLIDDSIYRGTGLIVPCEFGDLDRWLEPMWFEVCQERSGFDPGLISGMLKG